MFSLFEFGLVNDYFTLRQLAVCIASLVIKLNKLSMIHPTFNAKSKMKKSMRLYGFLSYNKRKKSSMVLRFGYVKGRDIIFIINSYEIIKTATWSVIIYIPLSYV